MDSQELDHKELLFDKSRDMSAVDHAVILGSSIIYRGKPYNFEIFRTQAASGTIDPDALIPKGIEEGISQKELEKLQNRRANQRDLVGHFAFLDERSDELIKTKHGVRVQLVGLVDTSTLQADSVYRISVVDKFGFEVHDDSFLENLHLADSHKPYYDLDLTGDGSKLMILKSDPEK